MRHLCTITVPDFISPNFGNFLNQSSDIICWNFEKLKLKGCRRWPLVTPAGLRKGMVDWLGKVGRLGLVSLVCNLKWSLKNCHTVKIFSQVLLKYTTSANNYQNILIKILDNNNCNTIIKSTYYFSSVHWRLREHPECWSHQWHSASRHDRSHLHSRIGNRWHE